MGLNIKANTFRSPTVLGILWRWQAISQQLVPLSGLWPQLSACTASCAPIAPQMQRHSLIL